MEKYQRVEKPRPDVPPMENEIRLTSQGRPKNYITYAIILLGERGLSTVVFKAMGNAIGKAVTVAEVIKRRIPYLHQNTEISSVTIAYTWEPLEEGLLPLETTKHVSTIKITLSSSQLDTSSPGYQPPLPIDQVKPLIGHSPFVAGNGRALGRGCMGASHYLYRHGLGYVPPQGHGRGRGRSSGNAQYAHGNFNDNGMRGQGRGTFGYDDNYNDNGFRRGRGSGQDRIGSNNRGGGDEAFPGRGRGGERARGRGWQELIPMDRLNE